MKFPCSLCGQLRDIKQVHLVRAATGLEGHCLICLCKGNEALARLFLGYGEAIKRGAEEIKARMDSL